MARAVAGVQPPWEPKSLTSAKPWCALWRCCVVQPRPAASHSLGRVRRRRWARLVLPGLADMVHKNIRDGQLSIIFPNGEEIRAGDPDSKEDPIQVRGVACPP